MKITIRYRFIVGIDIGKNWLDVYLFDQKTGQGHSTQVANNKSGLQTLHRWLVDLQIDPQQTVLCSEHAGRYGERLLAWTTEQGWPHALLKTTALQKVTPEHHRKTDHYDAQMLAEYGRRYTDRLRLQKAPDKALKQINRLKNERKAMVADRAKLRQKRSEADYHDADMKRIKHLWDQQIQLLTKHINQLETRIKKIIQNNDYLHTLYKRMRTAPGLGKVITPVWISMFAGRHKLNPRKISSRFGFAPHPVTSGSSVHRPATSSGYGNGYIRGLLHEAAQSVTTHYPHYQEYKQRKLAEGKHHLVVINNVINKLIRLYCAMWNNKTMYDPDYIEKCNNPKKVA